MKMYYASVIRVGLLFLSCSDLIPRIATPKEFIVYGFDFTKCANQGFLFTPLEVLDRPYGGRGLLRIEGCPKVNLKSSYYNNERNVPIEEKTFKQDQLQPEELIEEAYKYAKSIGADAIIQFKISKNQCNRGNIQVEGLELSGFAIKRL